MYNGLDESFGVRPAIHLNLSKIINYTEVDKPANTTVKYTGSNITASDIQSVATWFDPSKMTITFPTDCKNVGSYTCTVTLTDEDSYFANGEKTATFELTITKAPLVIKVTLDENKNPTITYNGLLGSDTAPTTNALFCNEELQLTLDSFPADPEPGEYYVVPNMTDAWSAALANYEITDIDPAKITILESVDDNGHIVVAEPYLTQKEFIYNGSPVDIINYFEAVDTTYVNLSGDMQPTEVGEYTVTATINTANVYWATGHENQVEDNTPITYTFKITSIKIDDTWVKDDNNVPELPTTDSDKFDYIFYDKDGNPVVKDDGTPATKDDLTPGETYKVVAVIKDEYKDNYDFESNGEDKTEPIEFIYGHPAQLTVPTLENSELLYTGDEQTVTLIGFDDTYMEYDPSELTKIDADTYTITIRIKDGAFAEWADGLPGTERTLTFTIEKVAIDSVWEFEDTSPDLAKLPEDATVTYIIKDDNGNTVDVENVVEGEAYTVTAMLTDRSATNYYFADSGTDSVVTRFMYYAVEDELVNEVIEEILPFWSFFIIVLALVGGAVVWSKSCTNVRENREDKRAKKQAEQAEQNNQ
jgi:hypothetical protein